MAELDTQSAAGRHEFDPRPRWSPNVEDAPPCRHCGLPADDPIHERAAAAERHEYLPGAWVERCGHVSRAVEGGSTCGRAPDHPIHQPTAQPVAEADQLPEDVNDLLHVLWLHHYDDKSPIGQTTAMALRAFRGTRRRFEELSAERDRLEDEVNRLRLETSVHQPATRGEGGFVADPPAPADPLTEARVAESIAAARANQAFANRLAERLEADAHILDRLARPEDESCAGCGHAPAEHPIHCDAFLDAIPDLGHTAPRVPRRRLQGCVDAWPDAEDGAYNPACCRFPKACSPHPYPREDPTLGPKLEPMPTWGRDPDEDPR